MEEIVKVYARGEVVDLCGPVVLGLRVREVGLAQVARAHAAPAGVASSFGPERPHDAREVVSHRRLLRGPPPRDDGAIAPAAAGARPLASDVSVADERETHADAGPVAEHRPRRLGVVWGPDRDAPVRLAVSHALPAVGRPRRAPRAPARVAPHDVGALAGHLDAPRRRPPSLVTPAEPRRTGADGPPPDLAPALLHVLHVGHEVGARVAHLPPAARWAPVTAAQDDVGELRVVALSP